MSKHHVPQTVCVAYLGAELHSIGAHPPLLLRRATHRYDPATGDIKLACTRFPTREENRRWCLGALHRLVTEANRAAPSAGFALAHLQDSSGAAGSAPA